MAEKSTLKIVILGCLIIFVLAPLAVLIVRSFAVDWHYPGLFPAGLGLRGWLILFAETGMVDALQTTFLIGCVVAALNLALGMSAGKALAFYRFKGKELLESFFLLPILIPALALAMGLQIAMIHLGLSNHWPGVVLIHLLPTLPYSIRIFRAGFENIGLKWEEQAKTLGAGGLTIFMTIYLPLLLPGIRSAASLAFVISLSQYVLTILIGGGNVVTLSMIYFPYFQGSNQAVMAAFSLVFALLPIIFYLGMELMIKLFVPHHNYFSKKVNL